MPVNGLVARVPTSVSADSGTPTIATNGTVTFTATVGLTLNGVFSSAYDNYMLVTRVKATSVGQDFVLARMVVGGVVATANNYQRQEMKVYSTTVAGTRTSATGSMYLGQFELLAPNVTTAFIFAPYLAQHTTVRTIGTTSAATVFDYVNSHSLSNSYDGIRIYSNSVSLSMEGDVTVYGFNQ